MQYQPAVRDLADSYLYGWTIAGGSNEVMRNVFSERLLGMPR
ncbi:hypothetical protein [uncultured Novosphingobium sp.]